MTTETGADAIGYSQEMITRLRAQLTLHGHGACRHDDNARMDFTTGHIVCGCGHRVQVEGAQQFVPDVDGPRDAVVASRDPVRATLETIDPTIAYTPVDLEMRILDILARLEVGAVFERKAVEDDTAAKLAWKKAYWIAKNASEASAADRREADAMVQTLELYLDHVEKEMVRKAVAATMHNLRSMLSGYQSVAKSVNADFGAGGSNR
jgi:hypothetical protein